MLDWQREPGTRKFARNPAVPSKRQHVAWLTSKLADPAVLINIVLHGGEPVGVLRVDKMADEEHSCFEVSIFITGARQRLGLGAASLRLARRLVREGILCAHIEAENTASMALFRKAGYKLENGWYRQYPEARYQDVTL